MSAAVALTAGLAVASVPSSGAASHRVLQVTDDATAPGTRATPAAQAQPAKSTTVTLPTGDHVRVDPASGGEQATPTSAGTAGGAATYVRFTSQGDQYVIPDAAVSYLHTTLDPRLFDVSYLARAKLGTSAAAPIPVRIKYTSATAAATLPGVGHVHRSGATATATITGAQAGKLGRLLATRGGHPAASAGQLAGIANISLAQAPGAPPLPTSPTQAPTQPSAKANAAGGTPFYTLTLNATDLNGDPGTFAGMVQNVDDIGLYDRTACVINAGCTLGAATGSESLSVPEGTYSLAISVVTPDPSGSGFDTALVVKPQVTVDSNTTVDLDARTAVPYQAGLSTPVTASQRIDVLQFWRTGVDGGGDGAIGGHLAGSNALTMGLVAISNQSDPLHARGLLAAPTTAVTKGSFVFDASSNLKTGSTASPGPTYSLDFPHQGTVPSSLTYTVPAADLTTVNSEVHKAPSGCGQQEFNTFGFLRLAPDLWERNMYFATTALPTGPRTDYWYSGAPQLDLWEPGLVACATEYFYYGPAQRIAPGQQISEVWNKTPAVPSPAAPPTEHPNAIVPAWTKNSDPRLTVCTACRQDDIGTVNILPFADSDPAHHSWEPGFGVGPTSDIRFYRDGTLAIDSATQGQGTTGSYPWGLELPLLSQAAGYELDSTETRQGDDAATIDTDWTFHSGPADRAASLPDLEMCAPDATRACSFLPLLFLRYDLPLNDNDQAAAGTPEKVDFAITAQQNAPAPSGLSATVSASFDDGKTWSTPQSATDLGNGRFTATVDQPALAGTSGFASLRVTAKDGSGNSVTQTIIRAYGLTS